jgi:hypothetical protein
LHPLHFHRWHENESLPHVRALPNAHRGRRAEEQKITAGVKTKGQKSIGKQTIGKRTTKEFILRSLHESNNNFSIPIPRPSESHNFPDAFDKHTIQLSLSNFYIA